MSLNGLDAKDIHEAYQATASEPGGWWVMTMSLRSRVMRLHRNDQSDEALSESSTTARHAC